MLNASQATNFNFKIEGGEFADLSCIRVGAEESLGRKMRCQWGGYMVIKESGDILCYHFYDRNRFEDYLFSNVYLERSSTSRHKYATIIKDAEGKLIFKLNLQVRLK